MRRCLVKNKKSEKEERKKEGLNFDFGSEK